MKALERREEVAEERVERLPHLRHCRRVLWECRHNAADGALADAEACDGAQTSLAPWADFDGARDREDDKVRRGDCVEVGHEVAVGWREELQRRAWVEEADAERASLDVSRHNSRRSAWIESTHSTCLMPCAVSLTVSVLTRSAAAPRSSLMMAVPSESSHS